MNIFRFRDRVDVLDERSRHFLTTVAWLGGYVTPDQAQVTKSVARLMGADLSARRQHAIETVRTRLLTVNFYLAAIRWPAEFVFDHEQKLSRFWGFGCEPGLLPQRGSKPYLCQDSVLKRPSGDLAECLGLIQDELKLLVVTGSDARYPVGPIRSNAVSATQVSYRGVGEDHSRFAGYAKKAADWAANRGRDLPPNPLPCFSFIPFQYRPFRGDGLWGWQSRKGYPSATGGSEYVAGHGFVPRLRWLGGEVTAWAKIFVW